MATRKDDSGGKVFGMLFMVALVVAAIYLYQQEQKNPDNLVENERKDPESALKVYLRTAYKYMHNEGVTANDVEKCVTKSDWDWYNDNFTTIAGNPFGITTAANPNEARALQRRLALNALLDYGPNREDTEIVDRQIGADQCEFTCRKTLEMSKYVDMKVVLVMEDGAWKVENFAGARAMMAGGK